MHALRGEFGARLRSVWFYGSRPRGEQPGLESDVDPLVVLDQRTWEDEHRVHDVVWKAADSVEAQGAYFPAFVYDVERIAQRREIDSFFIQEVDRDKIVLFGEP